MERGWGDGKIYFAATQDGRIYRFNELGNTVSNLEIFVERGFYDVDGAGPLGTSEFSWPDNLAFDGDANLWVLQDGLHDGGNNNIWVVEPTHTAATPAIKSFATTPMACEPTGITFSPDYKYLFLSIQHPDPANTAGQQDAANANVIFNTGTSIVIARKENLGNIVVPVRFLNLDLLLKNNNVKINWKTANEKENGWYTIERSTDGTHFTAINKIKIAPNTTGEGSYRFLDNQVPAVSTVYYRIQQCDVNNECLYSTIKKVRKDYKSELHLFPSPVNNLLQVSYYTDKASTILIQIVNVEGKIIFSQQKQIPKGANHITLPVSHLAMGSYIVMVMEGEKISSASFIK